MEIVRKGFAVTVCQKYRVFITWTCGLCNKVLVIHQMHMLAGCELQGLFGVGSLMPHYVFCRSNIVNTGLNIARDSNPNCLVENMSNRCQFFCCTSWRGHFPSTRVRSGFRKALLLLHMNDVWGGKCLCYQRSDFFPSRLLLQSPLQCSERSVSEQG